MVKTKTESAGKKKKTTDTVPKKKKTPKMSGHDFLAKHGVHWMDSKIKMNDAKKVLERLRCLL